MTWLHKHHKVDCPACGIAVDLDKPPAKIVGTEFTCPECDAVLRVTNLNPAEVEQVKQASVPRRESPESKKCKACGAVVTGSHDCLVVGRTIEYDDSDFLLSMVVAAATGSGVLGYAAGGSLAGAVVGSALAGDDKPAEPSAHCSGTADDTPATEPGTEPGAQTDNSATDDASDQPEPSEPADSSESSVEESSVSDSSSDSSSSSDTGSSSDN
jgi:hypothetical protein